MSTRVAQDAKSKLTPVDAPMGMTNVKDDPGATACVTSAPVEAMALAAPQLLLSEALLTSGEVQQRPTELLKLPVMLPVFWMVCTN